MIGYSLHGKSASMALGRWPELSVTDARKLAGEKIAMVDRGDDPRGAVETVDAAFEIYWKTRAGELKHPAAVRSVWDRLISPVIGRMPVGKLGPKFFDDHQAHWVDQGMGAGQSTPLRICRHFDGWLLDRDMIDRGFVPRRVTLPEGGSYPVPTFEETQAFYGWCCENAEEAHAQIIALLILTGARLEMIRGLQ